MRNSEIILVGDMKLDSEYRNVLTYSESEMLALCRQKQIATASNYSFLKPGENVIIVGFDYATCLKCDYIAFQNSDYSNKWFFAFVNRVEYSTESATKLHYQIDEFSTWFDYWSPKTCYIVREHVNDDSIGANTIPEGLETGPYAIVSEPIKLNNYDSGTYICMGVSALPDEIVVDDNAKTKTFNGIYSGLYYLIFSDADFVTNMITIYDKKAMADAIVNLFLVPKVFAIDTDSAQACAGNIDGIPYAFFLPYAVNSFYTIVDNYSFNINNSLARGYVPGNKKLFTYPYNYFVLTNNAGTDIEMRYENFVNNTPSFKIIGSITPGCSIRCIPKNLFISDNANSFNAYNYGIQGAKFPVCSWNSDTYTNWLTSNGVNMFVSSISQMAQIGIGALMMAGAPFTGGTSGVVGGSMIAGGLAGLVGNASEVYQHNLIPEQARGNTSAGDISYSSGNTVFTVYRMSIKPEYAKCIDDMFTKIGYKVNRNKYPNLTGRENYNFVQIANTENIGYSNKTISVPASSMDIINKIFRNGTTLWHNYTNLGDYSVSNNIVN